jgi:membrane protein DedA with SNARE-associated domain
MYQTLILNVPLLTAYEEIFSEIFSIGGNIGYVGVLVVTFLISMIVFVPIPYVPVLIVALLSGKFEPDLLALASATGVTLGRTAIFLASYHGRTIIKKKALTRMSPLQLLLAKYGSLGSFIAALTPFPPDDIFIILLGISKFSPWKFVVTSFFGKLIVNFAVVWIVLFWGRPLATQMLSRNADATYLFFITLVSILLVGFLIYSVTRLDWGSIIGKWFPWTLDGQNNDDTERDG